MGASLSKKACVAMCLLSSVAGENPWSIRFGTCSEPNAPDSTDCCTFLGDYAGAPLSRIGACASESGVLDLSMKRITGLPADVFAGMGSLQ
jgi:hypothetical protein